MKMETLDWSRMKLYVFQVVTVICVLVLFVVCEGIPGLRYRALFLVIISGQIFVPNLTRKFSGAVIPFEVMRDCVIVIGAFMWTYIAYIMAGILLFAYQGVLGFYVYFMVFIPPMIFAAYVAHTGEWRRFIRSLTRSTFDEYMRKEAEEKAAQIEIELKKRGIELPPAENPEENSHDEDCQTTED